MANDILVSVGSLGTNMEAFADAISQLGRHAAAMDQANELEHDGCVYCETMKMLSRVTDFGAQLRVTP